MNAGELCERLEAFDCTYEVMHLPDGGVVRYLTRQVGGRMFQVPLDVTHADDELEDETVARICRRLGNIDPSVLRPSAQC